MFCLSILLTLVFSLFLLPKNPLFAAGSELVFTNVLYSNKSVALFVLFDVSVIAFGWIWIFICLAFLVSPEPLIVIVYWSPILVVLSEPYAGELVPTVLVIPVVTSFPSTKTFIKFAFKLLALKYLSVPLTVIVAVWSAALADELTFSHIGSTTSTTFPSVPNFSPAISIPEVIVNALFLFPDVSANLSLATATVITPL